MSNSEKRAREFFPGEDGNSLKTKLGFLIGYNQAEKDLALTWEDIKLIDSLIDDVALEETDAPIEYLYQKVLNRFNKQKGK